MFSELKNIFRESKKELDDIKFSMGSKRTPFYKLAEKYIPANNETVIVDIGSGRGEFIKFLRLEDRYKKIFLLDANNDTIEINKQDFKVAKPLYYSAPGKLPFKEREIDFIHCSHLVEHLYPNELYEFLKNIDAVLKLGGVLVISTPLLWEKFYNDLTHVKPYNPKVFIKYLSLPVDNPSNKRISNNYKVIELKYRYRTERISFPLHKNLLINILVKILMRAISFIGFKNFKKNGYTIILKKIK